MNDLTQLWLQMLLLLAVIGAASRVREGWRWNSGAIAQHAILAAIAAFGIFVGSPETCMWLGWGLFILTRVWPGVLMRRLQHHITMLDAVSAQEEARRLRLFFWGPPGAFWAALAQALAQSLDGQAVEARTTLLPYMEAPTPRSYRIAAMSSLQGLRVVERDWEGLVADFAACIPDDGSAVPPGFADAAFRGYLELGDVPGARRTLERARATSARRPPRDVQLQEVTFYALTGATAELERALMPLRLPPFAADAWRARCLAANGRLDEALRLMATAVDGVPEDQPQLADRLRHQLADLPFAPHTALDPATAGEVAAARGAFEQMHHVAGILAPARGSWGVLLVVGAIALAFLPAHAYAWFPSDHTLALADWFLAHGQLTASAFAGEPWRLITYQFLHADIFHVGLNLAVLWMFGRQAEALFGSSAMLVVFFVTGVAGGAVQLFLAPEMHAIGASGAVLGVFGAVIGGLARSKDSLSPQVRKDQVTRLLAIAALQMVLDRFFADQIAVYIHAAGLGAGVLLGFVLPLRKPKPTQGITSAPRTAV